jgi:hypothetical protein
MSLNTTIMSPNLAPMKVQAFAGLAHTLQTAAVAALIFAVCVCIPKLKHRAQLSKLPVFERAESGEKRRQAYLTSAKGWYSEGYKKVRRS